MENEKRLIDANAFAGCLERMTKTAYPNLFPGLLEAIDYVRDFPTVDAVEVVRCEKCLYRSQYPDESGHYKCGGLLTEDEELILMVKPDFFCAYGERRGKDG